MLVFRCGSRLGDGGGGGLTGVIVLLVHARVARDILGSPRFVATTSAAEHLFKEAELGCGDCGEDQEEVEGIHLRLLES